VTEEHANHPNTEAAEAEELRVVALPARDTGERFELAYRPGNGRFYAQIWTGEQLVTQIGTGRAYLTPDALYEELCRQWAERGRPVLPLGDELLINTVLWVLTKGAAVPKPGAEPHVRTYDASEVGAALNKAADFTIEEARTDADEVITDAVNLVVNLGLGFLEDPAGDPMRIIGDAYDDDPDEVLSWIQ
jgi:hypothetical protein